MRGLISELKPDYHNLHLLYYTSSTCREILHYSLIQSLLLKAQQSGQQFKSTQKGIYKKSLSSVLMWKSKKHWTDLQRRDDIVTHIHKVRDIKLHLVFVPSHFEWHDASGCLYCYCCQTIFELNKTHHIYWYIIWYIMYDLKYKQSF